MQRKLFKDFCANPRNLREKIFLDTADIADHAEKIIQRFLRKSAQSVGKILLDPTDIVDRRREKSFRDFCANPLQSAGEDFY